MLILFGAAGDVDHELAGQLDLVDGQALEVGQRRRPAEVVECHANARLAQFGQRGNYVIRVAGHGAGQLDRQQARLESGVADGLEHFRGHAGRVQLDRRVRSR